MDSYDGKKHNIENREVIGSTGSPISPEALDFAYARIKKNV